MNNPYAKTLNLTKQATLNLKILDKKLEEFNESNYFERMYKTRETVKHCMKVFTKWAEITTATSERINQKFAELGI